MSELQLRGGLLVVVRNLIQFNLRGFLDEFEGGVLLRLLSFLCYVYHRTALPLLPDSTRHMPISRCLADTA